MLPSIKIKIMRISLLLVVITLFLFNCKKKESSKSSSGTSAATTNTTTTTNSVVASHTDSLIIGTWSSYGYYGVDLYANGNICSGGTITPATGISIVFSANKTFTCVQYGSGTWSYNPSNSRLTLNNTTVESAYYNISQVPGCNLTTPVGTWNPTLYFNYPESGARNLNACQYYIFSQHRFRKL